MRYDPFTLVITLGQSGDAEGTLYLDDGQSFDYQEGAFLHRKFHFSKAAGSLTNEDIGGAAAATSKKGKEYAKSMDKVRVEKVVVVGAPAEWKGKQEVTISEEGGSSSTAETRKAELDFHPQESGKAAWAVVRNPEVAIGQGWKITF